MFKNGLLGAEITDFDMTKLVYRIANNRDSLTLFKQTLMEINTACFFSV